MERMKLNPESLEVEAFQASADAVVVENPNDTISACPTSCACCD